ncbi:sensor histidine kinase [Actinomadura violacea]|uniref:Oxygen sensor histidine kinase NreB n=1 Tax=Actinomadura violacea TaxID=2819934 RepID=A0ABS3S690_9ACTN|nr:ATP-binding protein [Actinomadura violacea]MBO2463764.1 ATP-binding protein [Actinomadura violacea]
MGSSGTEAAAAGGGPVPERVGAAFRMLMQIRMLIAAVTLLLLPVQELTAVSFVLVLSIVVLSWLASRCWRFIAPHLAAHPLLFALDMGVLFTALGIGGLAGPFFLSTVVTAALAGLLYRWQGMLVVATLEILCYYTTYSLTITEKIDFSFQVVLGQPLYYPLAGFAGVALRHLLDDMVAQEADLRRAEVQAAAAEERARLAREMHDSLAKTLRGIAMAAAALPKWTFQDQSRAAREARGVAAAAEIASREARQLLSELREDALVRPLPEVFREVAESWAAATGTAVACELDASADLPVRVRHELKSILAEALENIDRHAGAARVGVRLAREGADVVITVTDDGRGFRPRPLADLAAGGHYGLIGLHERAERVGGMVLMASEPGAGTTLTVRLPAEEPVHERLAEV